MQPLAHSFARAVGSGDRPEAWRLWLEHVVPSLKRASLPAFVELGSPAHASIVEALALWQAALTGAFAGSDTPGPGVLAEGPDTTGWLVALSSPPALLCAFANWLGQAQEPKPEGQTPAAPGHLGEGQFARAADFLRAVLADDAQVASGLGRRALVLAALQRALQGFPESALDGCTCLALVAGDMLRTQAEALDSNGSECVPVDLLLAVGLLAHAARLFEVSCPPSDEPNPAPRLWGLFLGPAFLVAATSPAARYWLLECESVAGPALGMFLSLMTAGSPDPAVLAQAELVLQGVSDPTSPWLAALAAGRAALNPPPRHGPLPAPADPSPGLPGPESDLASEPAPPAGSDTTPASKVPPSAVGLSGLGRLRHLLFGLRQGLLAAVAAAAANGGRLLGPESRAAMRGAIARLLPTIDPSNRALALNAMLAVLSGALMLRLLWSRRRQALLRASSGATP